MKDEILIFHINLKFFWGISKKRNTQRNGEKNEKILLIQSHLLYWMKHDGLHISNVSYSTTFLTKEIRLISCNFYCVMLQVIYYNFDKFIDS